MGDQSAHAPIGCGAIVRTLSETKVGDQPAGAIGLVIGQAPNGPNRYSVMFPGDAFTYSLAAKDVEVLRGLDHQSWWKKQRDAALREPVLANAASKLARGQLRAELARERQRNATLLTEVKSWIEQTIRADGEAARARDERDELRAHGVARDIGEANEQMRRELDEHRMKLNDALGIVGAEEDIDPYEAVVALHTEIDRLRAERDEVGRQHKLCHEQRDQAWRDLDAVKANAIVLTDALHRLGGLIATNSRDWVVDRCDAWIYGLFCGWDCDEDHVHGPDCDVTPSIAERHGWLGYDVGRLRRYRAAIAAVQNGGLPDTEATEQAKPRAVASRGGIFCRRCSQLFDPTDGDHYHCTECGERSGAMGHQFGCPQPVAAPSTPTEPRLARPSYPVGTKVRRRLTPNTIGTVVAYDPPRDGIGKGYTVDWGTGVGMDFYGEGDLVPTSPAGAPTEPRVWRKGDPEPPEHIEVLVDCKDDHLPYLCRIPSSPQQWQWFERPDHRRHAPGGVPWDEATAVMGSGPKDYVVALPEMTGVVEAGAPAEDKP